MVDHINPIITLPVITLSGASTVVIPGQTLMQVPSYPGGFVAQ